MNILGLNNSSCLKCLLTSYQQFLFNFQTEFPPPHHYSIFLSPRKVVKFLKSASEERNTARRRAVTVTHTHKQLTSCEQTLTSLSLAFIKVSIQSMCRRRKKFARWKNNNNNNNRVELEDQKYCHHKHILYTISVFHGTFFRLRHLTFFNSPASQPPNQPEGDKTYLHISFAHKYC